MTLYELAYRTEGIGGYTYPYTEIGAFSNYEQAIGAIARLRESFPDAEFRLMEHRNVPVTVTW
jgi:hypothetical protein